jgi:HPt (histidine-containing phosphotransfer) domain-containing protein
VEESAQEDDPLRVPTPIRLPAWAPATSATVPPRADQEAAVKGLTARFAPPTAAMVLPVLDPRVLRRLGVELEDHAAARCVAEHFVELLPQRTRALTRSVRCRDLDTALDVVLSLKVTSATIGGRRMEEAARTLESHLRSGRWGDARRAASTVRRETPSLRRSLNALLGC